MKKYAIQNMSDNKYIAEVEIIKVTSVISASKTTSYVEKILWCEYLVNAQLFSKMEADDLFSKLDDVMIVEVKNEQ